MFYSLKVAKKHVHRYCFYKKHFMCWGLRGMVETDNLAYIEVLILLAVICSVQLVLSSDVYSGCCLLKSSTLFHIGGGGGADSARPQIVFFITSVRDAAEPQNLVAFP